MYYVRKKNIVIFCWCEGGLLAGKKITGIDPCVISPRFGWLW
jgi:hypothetical protein